MKNKDSWKPGKFVYKKGRLRASKDPGEVGIASRLTADLVAGFYDEWIRKHVHGKLLDLGCGKVPLYLAYKDYTDENICIDWGNTRHKNPFLDGESDLNNPLPLGDAEFDSVILSDVLEHIRYPEQLLAEICRVMKTEGTLLMNVPFYYWLHEEPHDYFRYTEFALRSFLEKAGFRILLLEPLGGAPEVMADIAAKNIVKVPFIGKPSALFVQSLTWHLVRTSLGKKISRKSALRFPLEYGIIAAK